jgi:hypothetical protein
MVIIFLLVTVTLSAQTERDSIRQSNRHDFIVVGNHQQELKTGDYIVVATTLTEEDAKRMIKEYKKLKVPEPLYAYVSNKSLWFIYFAGGNGIEVARQKRDEIRKNKVYKDAWLLTIHD